MLRFATRTALSSNPMNLVMPVNLNSPAADLSQYLDSPAVSTVQTPLQDQVFNIADSMDSLVKNTWLAAQVGKVYPTSGKPSAGATTASTTPASTQWLWLVGAAIVAFFAFKFV